MHARIGAQGRRGAGRRGLLRKDVDALWKVYVDLGLTELHQPETAVELAIVLEELGRATDPTPFLATMTQFAPLVGEQHRPDGSTGAAVYSGVTAHRNAGGWVLDGTAVGVLDADRADRLAVVTAAGVFVVDAGAVTTRKSTVLTRRCTSATCPSPASRSPTRPGSAAMSSEPATSHCAGWR